MVRGAAPALLRVGGDSDGRLLVLVRTTRRRATLLGPTGARDVRPLADLYAALVPQRAAAGASSVEEMLDRARVETSRRSRARAALLRERFAHERVDGVWIVRRLPSAPFLEQLRGAGLFGRLGGLVTLQVAQMTLFIASWWVLGTSALAGHLDTGWLVAWALLLVTIVPLRAAATRSEGILAIEAGVLLKRRLLAGALALEQDETRADGAGHMLARVLESEVVEQLALDAGGAALFVFVDLVSASLVLAVGTMPAFELMLLAVFVFVGILLGRALMQRRDAWTDARLGLTHEMVEGLVGHRTRVAQEARDEWHDAEDQAVSRTFEASRRLDRVAITMAAALPRAWLVASVGALSYALVSGPREPVGVSVTIGGALVAFRAFRRAAQGAGAVVGVAVAWKRVKALFDAAARPKVSASPRVVVQREERASVSGELLVEARDLGFGYPNRRADVLSNVSFRIGRNEHVLLLGPSGGGKSTLAALMAGLRRPSAGLLLLDGLDGRTLGGAGWRRLVASAPQFHDNHVLGGTLAFNLLMGRAWPPQPTDLVDAEAVCRELGLGDLLDKMPAGLLQTVGETGWQLSHGERSRVYLARALLQDAALVVLDESFAALDAATLAMAVGCARRRAMALVVIAHP
jgi:ATP-binding cassette subfamily B protein